MSKNKGPYLDEYSRPWETLRRFGPKREDHPSIGKPCQACDQPFKAGEYTTLIPLGPGDNPESRSECRDGSAYNAVAVEVHWGCATGDE